jgi:hypothetical protein
MPVFAASELCEARYSSLMRARNIWSGVSALIADHCQGAGMMGSAVVTKPSGAGQGTGFDRR